MPVGTSDLKFRVLAEVIGAQAIEGLKGKIDDIAKSSKFLTSAVGTLGAAFGAHEVIEFGKGILDTAENLNHLSQKTGVAVDVLAGMQGAAEMAGVPIENLAKGLNKLAINLVDANNGNQALAGTFANLGIKLYDSNKQLKDSGQIMKELADKFAGLKNGNEKAAIANQLFGKSGKDMILVLNQGSDAFDKLGLKIGTDFAGRATKFNETIEQIGINIKNNAIANIEALIPTLQELASAFSDFSKSGNSSTGFIDLLGEALRRVAELGVIVYDSFKLVIDQATTGFKELKAFLSDPIDIKGNWFGNKATSEVAALDKGLLDRTKQMKADEDSFLAALNKNSLLFGKGSTAQIKSRQIGDTAPDPDAAAKAAAAEAAAKAAAQIGLNAITIRSFEEKIAKINAEASAEEMSNAQKEKTVLLAELESKGILKTSAAYGMLSEKITKATHDLNEAKEKQSASNFQQKQEEEINLQKLQIDNYDLSAAELQKLVIAKQLDNQATEATKKFTVEGKAAYMDATESVKEQRLALIDLQEQQKQTWSVGAKQALNDYLENARDVAAQTRALFAKAFANMEDALVDFVKTGKLNFKKFADDIIDDIIRIQVKAAIAQSVIGVGSALSGLFGHSNFSADKVGGGVGDTGGSVPVTAEAAKGGIMTARGMAKLSTYMGGGVATSPQMAVFGEGSRPEAFVPLPDGRRIPVAMSGGGGSNVHVTVNVESGAENTSSDSDKGAQLGKLISAAIRGELLNQKRPGGMLA